MISIETMKFRTAAMIGEELPLVFWRGNGRIVASDDDFGWAVAIEGKLRELLGEKP